MNELT